MPTYGTRTRDRSSFAARDDFWILAMRELGPRLRAFVARTGCGPDDSKEIVADVFAELADHEADFAQARSKWAFALPYARAACAQAVRRWRHERPLADEPTDISNLESSEEIERRWARRTAWVYHALAQLPPRQRNALELHLVHGMSYSDAAKTMGVSQSAVRKNVHTGLAHLRQMARVTKQHANVL